MIKDLEEKILKAAEAYYLHEPIISDQEFDRLVEELKQLDPENTLIKQVGFGVNKFGDKEELPISIRKSLNKVHDIRDGLIVHGEDSFQYWVSPKVDGFSCIIKYNDGVLEKAWTREGTIITKKCRYIKNIPLVISELKGEVFLRGELFISWKDFEHLKEDYVNPRNALGIINRKGFDHLQHITFYIHPFQKVYKDNHSIINKVYKNPFIAKEYYFEEYTDDGDHFSDVEKGLDYFKTIYSEETQIDGLVIVNDIHFGYPDIEHRSFAYKFGTQEVETEVEEVEWNPSSRGKLIPIIKYKPVELYGTVCVNCSGYNYDYIKENKIGKGSKIKITKANEIIPYLTEILSEGEFKDVLADYKPEDIKLVGKHLFLVNSSYRERIRLENFIKNFVDFDGFKRSEILLDIFEINRMDNLLLFFDSIEKDYFLEKLKENSIVALGEEIFNKIKTNKIRAKSFFLYFGIDGIGEKAAEKLCSIADVFFWNYENFHGEEYDYNVLRRLLTESGCNSLVIENVVNDEVLIDLSECWEWAKKTDRFSKEEDKKFAKTVVITGSLSKTKDEYKRELEKVGVKLDLTINKATNYLVADDVNGNSSKIKFAKKNNIPVISEQEMFDMFLKPIPF